MVFAACLVPFLLLLWPFWKLVTTGDAPELGANPVEYITHYTGTWTIRFLLITLCVTPLRKILNQPSWCATAACWASSPSSMSALHFMTWFIRTKSFSLSDMWADVLKRRFITMGMLASRCCCPWRLRRRQAGCAVLGFVKWQRLHRLIYFAALRVIHYYWLVKFRCALAAHVRRDTGVLMLYRFFHVEAVAGEARRAARGRYHSEYGVPSRLVPSAPAAHVEDSRLRLVYRVAGVFHDEPPGVGIAGDRIDGNLPQIAVAHQVLQRLRAFCLS